MRMRCAWEASPFRTINSASLWFTSEYYLYMLFGEVHTMEFIEARGSSALAIFLRPGFRRRDLTRRSSVRLCNLCASHLTATPIALRPLLGLLCGTVAATLRTYKPLPFLATFHSPPSRSISSSHMRRRHSFACIYLSRWHALILHTVLQKALSQQSTLRSIATSPRVFTSLPCPNPIRTGRFAPRSVFVRPTTKSYTSSF